MMTTLAEQLKKSLPLYAEFPAWQITIAASELHVTCIEILQQEGRLIALWGNDECEQRRGFSLNIAFAMREGLLCLYLPLESHHPQYPDISDIFPAAGRMQRATYDLLGIRASNQEDQRPWLRHAAWADNEFPLRKDFNANDVNYQDTHAHNEKIPEEKLQDEQRHAEKTHDAKSHTEKSQDESLKDVISHDINSNDNEHHGHDHKKNRDHHYPFIHVKGDGVHEIPVGPVHAEIIEPGHFRFHIVGEHVLRLEERLGYTHKGVEKCFENMDLMQGAPLAGRISGDSTVAYAWAYAMAVENVARVTVPQRALWFRALLLERERIMNHLGDLGALGNDAGLAFGLAQFSRLKEDTLVLNEKLFGHRYLRDLIIPGGVLCNIDGAAIGKLKIEIRTLTAEVRQLKQIYDDHAGLQDRFLNTGIVAPDLAAQLGLTGLAGRASGQMHDLRVQFPCTPYQHLKVRMALQRHGDVAARVAIRFAEIMESLTLLHKIIENIPAGIIHVELPAVKWGAFGMGWVEGWRGEILVAVTVGDNNQIRRAHVHDPSWQNWPVLEHAMMNNIVPDFPLINKSFNLSYSGCDL